MMKENQDIFPKYWGAFGIIFAPFLIRDNIVFLFYSQQEKHPQGPDINSPDLW